MGEGGSADASVDELVRRARPDSQLGEHTAKAELQRRLFGLPSRTTALARYVLLARLGQGGDGVVHRAWDPELDRDVAIKLLRRRSREAEQRLRREARALAQLSHPNVVKIHDVGHCDDAMFDDGRRSSVGTFLVMEYVRGGDLAAWLGERRPWRELVAAFCAIGRALAAAHDVGIVHRDMKPSNVLIDERGRPLLVDFGLAERSHDASSGSETHVVGTLPYMAPEQHRGAIADAGADQYAFAVSLYEALAGQRPFIGPHRAMLDAKDHAVYPKLLQVPKEIRAAIARALAPAPKDRYADMHELVRALERGLVSRRTAWWLTAAVIPVALASVWLSRDETCALPAAGPHATLQRERAGLLARMTDDDGTAIAAVDGIASAWTTTWRDACLRTRVHDEQSAARFDGQLACLDRTAIAFDVALEQLGDIELRAPAHAAALGEIVEPPGRCAEPSIDLTVGDWGPAAQWQVLARARALRWLGRDADALALVRGSLRELQSTDAPKLSARLHLVAAEAHADLGEYAQASQELFAAVWAAERVRDDAIAAAAWIELAWLHGVERGDEVGERWASFAAAAVARAGASPRLVAELSHLRGGLAYHHERYDEALVAYRDALARQRALFGAEHPSVARTLNHIGNTLAMIDRLDDAFGHSSRALAVRQRSLPPGHPLIAAALNNLAGIRIQQLRFEEALAFTDESLTLGEGHGGPHELVARVLRAQSLRGLGRVEEAISNYRGALAVHMAAIERDHSVVSVITHALAELTPAPRTSPAAAAAP